VKRKVNFFTSDRTDAERLTGLEENRFIEFRFNWQLEGNERLHQIILMFCQNDIGLKSTN
jgi:hypothetical protein